MEGAAIIGMVPGHAYLALNNLATIAREAEAMCEWLVDITASHAVAANLLREDETRDEYKVRLLKAASEAVKS